MKLDQFNRTVIETCLNRCKGALIVLGIAIVLLIIRIVYYRATKNNNGLTLFLFIFPIRENRFSTKDQIFIQALCSVLLLVVIGGKMVPAFKDVSKQQYVCVSGTCTYVGGKTNKILSASNGQVKVVTNEGTFSLEVPVGWHTDELPDNNVQGQIYYSKETKILLSFTEQTN